MPSPKPISVSCMPTAGASRRTTSRRRDGIARLPTKTKAYAQTNLGFLYANGRGVAQDYVEAARWYRKAADQGYADAQTGLGVLFDKGLGVAQDSAEAERWFRKAARGASPRPLTPVPRSSAR